MNLPHNHRPRFGPFCEDCYQCDPVTEEEAIGGPYEETLVYFTCSHYHACENTYEKYMTRYEEEAM